MHQDFERHQISKDDPAFQYDVRKDFGVKLKAGILFCILIFWILLAQYYRIFLAHNDLVYALFLFIYFYFCVLYLLLILKEDFGDFPSYNRSLQHFHLSSLQNRQAIGTLILEIVRKVNGRCHSLTWKHLIFWYNLFMSFIRNGPNITLTLVFNPLPLKKGKQDTWMGYETHGLLLFLFFSINVNVDGGVGVVNAVQCYNSYCLWGMGTKILKSLNSMYTFYLQIIKDNKVRY